MVRGNNSDENKNEWVTQFEIDYLIPNSDKWAPLGKKYSANIDQDTIKEVDVDVATESLRIYPTQWNAWPSMRVGFKGVTYELKKCEKYQNLQTYGKTEEQKNKFKNLFDKECRKISYSKHLLKIKAEEEAYLELNKKYQELSQALKAHIPPTPAALPAPASVPAPIAVPVQRVSNNPDIIKIKEDIDRLKRKLQISGSSTIEGFSSYLEGGGPTKCKKRPKKDKTKKPKKDKKTKNPQKDKNCKKPKKDKRPKKSKKSKRPKKSKKSKKPKNSKKRKGSKKSKNDKSCQRKENSTLQKFPVVVAKMMIKSECAVPTSELKNYIKRSQARQILAKRIANMPIEKHPQYQNFLETTNHRAELQDKLITCSKSKIDKMTRAEIKELKKLKTKKPEICQTYFLKKSNGKNK